MIIIIIIIIIVSRSVHQLLFFLIKPQILQLLKAAVFQQVILYKCIWLYFFNHWMCTICLQTKLLLLDDVCNKVYPSIRFEFCRKRGKENLLHNITLHVSATDKDGVAPKVMISVLNVFILDLPSLRHHTHHEGP